MRMKSENTFYTYNKLGPESSILLTISIMISIPEWTSSVSRTIFIIMLVYINLHNMMFILKKAVYKTLSSYNLIAILNMHGYICIVKFMKILIFS